MQGRRPGLVPLLHELEVNKKEKPDKPTSRVFIAHHSTPWLGPGLEDLEMVIFYPKSSLQFSQIKVTGQKREVSDRKRI